MKRRYAGVLTDLQERGVEHSLWEIHRRGICWWSVDDDDLRQEAALAIWRAEKENRGEPLAWHVMLGHLRAMGAPRVARGQRHSIERWPDWLSFNPDPSQDVESSARMRDALAIAMGPEREFIETVLACDTHEEVAVLMNCSPSWVTQRLQRLRRQMAAAV